MRTHRNYSAVAYKFGNCLYYLRNHDGGPMYDNRHAFIEPYEAAGFDHCGQRNEYWAWITGAKE